MSQTLSCKSCDRAIEGAALACGGCGALHHEGCHRTAGHCAVCASAKGAVAVSVGGRDRSRAVALLSASLALFTLVTGVMRVPPPVPGPVTARPASVDVAGRWHGAISGNDPRVIADLELKQTGNELEGELRWTSANSGRNVRTVRGHLVPDRGLVILRDVGMPVAEAAGGWRFCPVDHYLLDVRGDQLTGNYWSSECSDQARVLLRRIR